MIATYAGGGLRVLAVAQRALEPEAAIPHRREEAERDLCFLGLVAMLDPPRPEVPDAVARVPRVRASGSSSITGDNGLTAAAIARRVGIDGRPPHDRVGEEQIRMSDADLDRLLSEQQRADLRPQLARGQAAHRRRATSGGSRGGDDGRRCQRCARPAPGGHRRGDGPLRDRCGTRGLHDGAHRRQLRHDRRGGRGRPSGLRQHPEVHPLHLRPHHAGGHSVRGVCPRRRSHTAAADGSPASRLRRRHRDPAGSGAGPRASRARDHGTPPRASAPKA